MASDNFWTLKFAWPRYAAGWIGYAFLRTIVLFPFTWQLKLGKRLGRVARFCFPGRRRIAAANLRVCFPELTPGERDDLLRRHFEAIGASVVETAMGWFGPEQAVRERVRIEGEQHLRAALGRGRGVILFSAHFTTFEFFWPALAPLCPRLSAMYKSARNPVMNKMMTRGRGRSFTDGLFAKNHIRDLLKSLARNAVVWYAADQSFASKGSALLPFFNEPAMTNTAIGRIARASGSVVLPCFCRRLDDSSYLMNIGAPLLNLPSDDPERDTLRLVRVLEDYIRLCPEQYWWIHRRFKWRPAPYPDIYRAVDEPG
jgi:KDO2-lipid IV(A) lauroyltransferase